MTGSPPAGRSSAAYWVLAALFAMNLLNYVDRFILAAVLKPVKESLTLSDKEAGFLTTIFFISYTLFSPVTGWFGDRVTRKYLLAAGVAVWSLATFASGLVETYGQMLLARSVLGVGEATYAILAPTLIADFFPRDKRSRALAIFYVAIPIGAALGYVLGGQIDKHHEQLRLLPLIEGTLTSLTGQQFDPASRGWRLAFFVVGIPGLVVALTALLLPEPPRGATEDVDAELRAQHAALPLSWSVYADLLRNRSYVYNALGMAMFTFALGGLHTWAPTFLATPPDAMPLDQADLGLGIVVGISGLVGTLLGAWLADRLAARYRGAYFTMSGIAMLLAVPFIIAALLTALHGGPHLVIFGCILFGLTLAFLNYGPSNAIIINVTMPRIRAAAFAINVFVIHLLGDIPSPFLIGAVSDWTKGLVPGDKHSLFWGLGITVPTMIASGIFFCLGSSHLEADQEAVLKELRSGPPGDSKQG